MRRRGRLRLNIEVDDKAIASRLEKAIRSGIASAGTEVGEVGEAAAKSKIREEDAIWKGELINSFTTTNTRIGRHRVVVITNTSQHAPYVEHGTEKYTRAPPLAKLIPWVETKLQGWTVRDGRLVPK